MKLVFDPEYDAGYVDFTELQDGHHTERPYDVDKSGRVVGMDLEYLSQGIDLADPRLPKEHLPELARRLRRKGYNVSLNQPTPARR